MHYYFNTMDSLGVSRHWLEDTGENLNQAVIVTWKPHAIEPDADGDDNLYLAVDSNQKIFYPMVCLDEKTNIVKVFLADNPEKGAETLKSAAQDYGQGGHGCLAVWLMQGYYTDDEYNGNNGGNGTESENPQLSSNKNSKRSRGGFGI